LTAFFQYCVIFPIVLECLEILWARPGGKDI